MKDIKTKNELTQYLSEEIAKLEVCEKDMGCASWVHEEGILITGNMAQFILQELQPAPLRPLRELAEDKEMCEEIARLCNPEKKEVFAVSSGNKFVKLVMEDYDLIVYKNGQLQYADDFGNQTPDNTFAICQLISSKYKIES